MHFQKSPFQEDKVVRCISGEVFDVIVDIRANSKIRGGQSNHEYAEAFEILRWVDG